MSIFKKAALAAALAAASLSVHAAETQITVWADVDPSLTLLRADGSALPDAVKLEHHPMNGLIAWKDNVRIYSNDTAKDVEVRLGHAPALISPDPGTAAVPMKVSLNYRDLTTATTDFLAADLFDGALPGASISMPLIIAQAASGPITAMGRYEGIVHIVMQQKTSSP